MIFRSLYKIVSNKFNLFGKAYGLVFFCFGILFSIVFLHQVGRLWLKWSFGNYYKLPNFYSDYASGESFHEKICQYGPIDAVYTWVNGSDPKLLNGLTHLNQPNETQFLNSCENLWPAQFTLVSPNLPAYFSVNDLKEEVEGLEDLERIIFDSSTNQTLLHFKSVNNIQVLQNLKEFSLGKTTYSSSQCYYVKEEDSKKGVQVKKAILLDDLPMKNENEILEALPPIITDEISHIIFHPKKNAVIIEFQSSTTLYANLSKYFGNVEVTTVLIDCTKCLKLETNADNGPSRYQDNDELKYSLRSLERNAPWINHIYLVTNGQIPHWLNLDNPHLTLITHDQIFNDIKALPTFSSPAIETQLHRIKGVSDKFLYINDDVFFGREVWPDDFYSPVTGQKIYLSWPVPECEEGCPDSWIHDGYCDKACNNSACMWDGGDCMMDTKNLSGEDEDNQYDKLEELNCAPSCSSNWLADKYCDDSCNVYSCGFDAGDCGAALFYLLESVDFQPEIKTYVIPNGSLSFYWNLSSILSREDGLQILEGTFTPSPVITTLAISIRYSLLILVLAPHHDTTIIELSLTFGDSYKSFTLLFNATVNTLYPKLNPSVLLSEVQDLEYAPNFGISHSTVRVNPIIFQINPIDVDSGVDTSLDVTNMSEVYRDAHKSLRRDLQLGILTPEGYTWKKKVLMMAFKNNPLINSHQLREEEYKLYSKYHALNSSTDSGAMSSIRPRLNNVPVLGELQDSLFRETYFLRSLYSSETRQQRKLLDTFADSLRHVNNLFNSVYGYEARKVPAHMPHLIDKNIMEELVSRFPEEFKKTTSHKVRQNDDMQFAFSYFYYLISERQKFNLDAKFKEIDTDNSGTWSDREIRTLLTQIYDLPLYLDVVEDFEKMLQECADHLPSGDMGPPSPRYERYPHSKLTSVISWEVVMNCTKVVNLLRNKFSRQKKFKYKFVSEDDVTFKMLSSNVSMTVAILDDIRKNPKKFIALNDNLDHNNAEHSDTRIVKTLLLDFYESLFPIPSSFELPGEYRNRFLYIEEMRAWMYYRDVLRSLSYLSITALILFSVASYFHLEIITYLRRLRRWHPKSSHSIA